MTKTLIYAAAAAVLAVAGCGGTTETATDPQQPTRDAPAASPAEPELDAEDDPYDVYLEIAPDKPDDWGGDWPISREDAQTRALLGCESEFAPGTVDAALAEAYADLCP